MGEEGREGDDDLHSCLPMNISVHSLKSRTVTMLYSTFRMGLITITSSRGRREVGVGEEGRGRGGRGFAQVFCLYLSVFIRRNYSLFFICFFLLKLH